MRQWLVFTEYVCCFAWICFALLCFVVEAKLPIECNFSLFIMECFSSLAAILIFTASNVGKVWTFLSEDGVSLFFSEQRVKLSRSDDFDKERK